jgi:hypothetical protein
MTLDVIDNSPAPLDVGYWGEVLTFAARMADAVGDTEFVPGAVRGRREAVAALIVYGAEVGLTPMQSLAGIHIVDGKPQPSAELCRAMILRAGHAFTVHEMTGTRCRVSGVRRGRPESERVVVEWTSDMARSAGLLGRPPWQRYPRAMLVARATGDLARILFPDVVKGLGYVAEDEPDALEAWAPPGQVDEPATPPRKVLQRRRRAANPSQVQSAPLPPDSPLAPDSGPPVVTVEESPAVVPDQYAPEVADAQQAHDENRSSGRWLTDDEAEATGPTPDEARAAIEAELAGVPNMEENDGKPSDPPPTRVSDDDEPLPEDLQPVGTGRPIPRLGPVPTLPELQPEQPSNEATPPGLRTLADRPFKAMQTGITRELGSAATDEERHALVSAIVGREITTTKTLPRDDGYRVLDWLDRFNDGDAWWEFVDGGARIVAHDGPRPVEG